MSDSIVGKEVSGYRVEEVLGRGGMGVVYKAEDLALQRPVAMKRLNPQLAGDESFLSRFRSEARAIARVDSPYIVQIFTLSETEIGLVIVMEYVEGRTLKQRIVAGETGWKESLPLMQQMLTALQHAHGAGVIHRDVKPQNILLSDIILAHGVRAKMTDFGLAKVNTTGDRSRTVTEGVYGTLYYMSPEQVEGYGEIDHRSDLYSLGMTFYEMLAGQLPFEEDSTEYTIMRTIVEEDLPGLGTFAPEVPDDLRDIVMTAVAKDPEDRFQSAEEMRNALGELEESSKQGYPDQEPSTIPADLRPPPGDPLAQDASEQESEASSGEGRKSPAGATGSRVSSPSMGWRVAGLGTALAVVLAGAWYLAGGPSAPSAGPEPTAAVEQSAPQGGAPEEAASGDAGGEESATGESSPEGTPEEPSADGAPPQTLDSSPETSGDTAPESSPESSAEESTPGETPETPEEEPTGSEAGESIAADQGAADPGETQSETRREDLPTPIAPLLDVTDPKVLSKLIDERVDKGTLTRGSGPEDFFTPDQCYIFVVEGDRVQAVLGPKTDGGRPNLRTGEKVEDWSSRYSDSTPIWTDLVGN